MWSGFKTFFRKDKNALIPFNSSIYMGGNTNGTLLPHYLQTTVKPNMCINSYKTFLSLKNISKFSFSTFTIGPKSNQGQQKAEVKMRIQDKKENIQYKQNDGLDWSSEGKADQKKRMKAKKKIKKIQCKYSYKLLHNHTLLSSSNLFCINSPSKMQKNEQTNNV